MIRTIRVNAEFRSELYIELQTVARQNQTTISELLRRGVALLLKLMEIQKNPNTKLIIREGSQEKELIIL